MMVLTLLLTATLSASPVRVAAPGFSVRGLDQKAGDFYSDQLAQQLAFRSLKVITRSEIQALLGNERQRQLLGCGEESSSCAIELADALGSDALMLGDVAKVGDKYRLSVRIVLTRNGERVSSAVITGSSEDTILDAFSSIAPKLAAETTAGVRGDGLPVQALGTSTERTGLKRLAWIPAAAGAVAVAGGAVAYLQAKDRYDALRAGGTLIEPVPSQLRSEGQTWQTVSLVGFGVGAAALATAAGFFFLGNEAVIEAGLAVGPGGGSIAIRGAF